MSERFRIAEPSGYPINPVGFTAGRWTTEYMVLDTAYCHRVVWTSLRNSDHVSVGTDPYRRRLSGREAADEVCRRFNANGSRLTEVYDNRDAAGRFA